ncbi:MAG: hypothetical protein ACRD3W_10560 [Terriglobales bacterium]
MNIHQPVSKNRPKIPRPGYRKERIYRTFREKGEKAALEDARKMKIADSSFKRWLSDWRKLADQAADYLSIRDLQKLSAESILALPGPTTIKSGNRAVALLVPLKPPDPKRLSEALKLAEELAKDRDPDEDEAALVAMGIDPTNWSEEAVRKLQEEWLAMK